MCSQISECLPQARAANRTWSFSMSEQHNQDAVLVLVCPQARGAWARSRLQKEIQGKLIPDRVIDYTPRMVTPKKVFRINCVMIPDSMVCQSRMRYSTPFCFANQPTSWATCFHVTADALVVRIRSCRHSATLTSDTLL